MIKYENWLGKEKRIEQQGKSADEIKLRFFAKTRQIILKVIIISDRIINLNISQTAGQELKYKQIQQQATHHTSTQPQMNSNNQEYALKQETKQHQQIEATENGSVQLLNILIITELKKEESRQLCNSAISILSQAKIFKIYTQDNQIFPNTCLYELPDKHHPLQSETSNGKQIYNNNGSQLNKKVNNIKFDYIISIGENYTMMRAFRIQYKQLRYKNCYNTFSLLKSNQNYKHSESQNSDKQIFTNSPQKQIGDNFNIQTVLQMQIKKKSSIQELLSPSKMFKVPIPIISISDGDQPIMSSYSHCQMEDILAKFIQGIKAKSLKAKQLIKFDIIEKNKAINTNSFSCQIQLHRDMSKSVLRLKIYAKFDQSKEFLHLTNIWGDGVIISTPVGSLGRNVSLSGPIVYRNLQSLTIVPISPLSLNFRPVILPPTAQIMIQVQENSRSHALVYADREHIHSLAPKNYIILKKSCQISRLIKDLSFKSNQQLWINCLRQVLSWGQAYRDPEKKEKTNF